MEDKYNIRYQNVLKMRFDQVFRKEHSWFNELIFMAQKTDLLYVCDHYNRLPEGVEDIAWYSNSETMDKVCNFSEARASVDGNHSDWQTHHMQYCIENNIVVRNWKDNTMMIYRDHHYDTLKVSPLDIDNIKRLP